jgi:hypothetical protein
VRGKKKQEALEAKKSQKRKVPASPATKKKQAKFMDPDDPREALSWWKALFK